MLFWCLILGFLPVCPSTKLRLSDVSYKSCTLLWYAKKEKYVHEIPVYFHKKSFFPGLASLGAPVRCTQNWYTAVKTDGFPFFVTFVSPSSRCDFPDTAPALSFGCAAL